MNRIEYGKLYKRATNRKSDKLGAIQEWEVWIEEIDGFPCIMRRSGQKDGKKNTKKLFIKKGKNIGKKNEQTPMEQALFRLTNMVKGKIEDNNVDDISKVDDPPKYIYPALASSHNVKKTEKLLKTRGYLYAQPKLNGARCWKINHIKGEQLFPLNEMTSRQLKVFDTIVHIKKDTAFFDDREITPDGEIFNPDLDFQTIISLLKKKYSVGDNPDYPDLGTYDLEYHIYDLAIPYKTYEERLELLEELFAEYFNNAGASITFLRPVETRKVTTMEEIDELHDKYVLLGYEGLILRDPESMYAFNDRNDSLIKYKKFYDDEFEIVGYETEIWDDVLKGKMRNLVVWRCITKDGLEFRSRPKGSFLLREKLYNEADKHIGKMLTVRYQELSQDKVPIMNIGLAIRDYE